MCNEWPADTRFLHSRRVGRAGNDERRDYREAGGGYTAKSQ